MKILTLLVIIILSGCSKSMNDPGFVSIEDDIIYTRHEPFYEPEEIVGDMFQFVYDIPYFGACGVFPPLHIFNQRMADGGGDVGMGPGASWDPFQLDQHNYSELVKKIKEIDPKMLKGKSRYYHFKFIEAPEFDFIQNQWEWLSQVCSKYRDKYHKENCKINGT